MKRLVASLALALAVVSAATAARGDPREQFTPTDQARAKAMLLRKADFGPGVKASKQSDEDFDFYCKALDESDLVLTGEADSLDFDATADGKFRTASSGAQIYKTAVQSAESWRRGTSAAGLQCAEAGFRKMAKEVDATFIYFRQIAFPRLAPQTAAYQVKLSKDGLPLIFDIIWFRNGRAQSGPFFAAAPGAYPREEEIRLARIVAQRTAQAMRDA